MDTQIIKRKILIESLRSRKDDYTYGTITADTIYLTVFFTQNIYDLGIFTDVMYLDKAWENQASNGVVPNENNHLIKNLLCSNFNGSLYLTNKLVPDGTVMPMFPFMTGATAEILFSSSAFTDDLRLSGRTVDYYYDNPHIVTGFTNSKLGEYKTYKRGELFKGGYNLDKYTYTNYAGQEVVGIKRITNPIGLVNFENEIVTYVDGADVNDQNIGTLQQNDGIVYMTYPHSGSSIITQFYNVQNLARLLNPNEPINVDTTFSFNALGCYSGNTSLSALVKDEIFLGIVSPPEVQSDVEIDRGAINAIERHLRLSEVESVDHLSKYGNGFYNIIKNNE